MPLLCTTITEAYSLALWQLTEPAAECRQLLEAARPGFLFPDHLRGEKRQREFAATRLLLHALLGEVPEVNYTPGGRPFLALDHHHISLSHSAALAAVILSPYPVGIDTEQTTRQVDPIAPRFLSDAEMKWTSQSPNPQQARIFCWSAKETIYKMIDQPGTDFKTGIHLPPTPMTDRGMITVTFTRNQVPHPAHLHFLFSGNNVVTWCVYPPENLLKDPPEHKQDLNEMHFTGVNISPWQNSIQDGSAGH